MCRSVTVQRSRPYTNRAALALALMGGRRAKRCRGRPRVLTECLAPACGETRRPSVEFFQSPLSTYGSDLSHARTSRTRARAAGPSHT
jgi:hypothetical protein